MLIVYENVRQAAWTLQFNNKLIVPGFLGRAAPVRVGTIVEQFKRSLTRVPKFA